MAIEATTTNGSGNGWVACRLDQHIEELRRWVGSLRRTLGHGPDSSDTVSDLVHDLGLLLSCAEDVIDHHDRLHEDDTVVRLTAG
jgi:hypothetical protein